MNRAARIVALASAFAASACMSGSQDEAQPSLAGSTWLLAELQSSDDAIGTVVPDDPTKYEMTLGEDGHAAFKLDCNRAFGPWASDTAGAISFEAIAMTRAACPEGSLDTRIASELTFVRTYILGGDRLVLFLMADGGTQTWVRQPTQ